MKKRILLIGYNFSPEPTGIGKYTGEMIAWFVNQGYDCTVVTSYPYYPFWKVQEPYFKRRFWYTREKQVDANSGGTLTTIRCPQYVPAQPSGLKRILLDLSFFIAAFFPLLGLLFRKKFDYAITIAPSFQIGLLGVLYKKVKRSKMAYHIQDMQIEAARDLKMIKSPGLIRALFKIEKYIFDQSEIVSSISEGMVSKIEEKAKKEVVMFPNWTDTNLFYPIKNRDDLKRAFGYEPTDKIALYSGSIGEKQGLEAILHAADALRTVKDLKFIICGSGPYKSELEKLANSLNLGNLNFLPIQPFEKFNQFLNLADIHLIIQKASASDLVMPSKLTTILSVGGLGLITANQGSGLNTLVAKYNMGVLVDAENQEALNAGLLKAATEDFSLLRKNARTYAENFLSINKIMANFEGAMFPNSLNNGHVVLGESRVNVNESSSASGGMGTEEKIGLKGAAGFVDPLADNSQIKSGVENFK